MAGRTLALLVLSPASRKARTRATIRSTSASCSPEWARVMPASVQQDRDHAVQESILGAVNSRVVAGIAGEDDSEFRVYGYMLTAQWQHSLLQHGKQHIVGLRPRTRELVIAHRTALLAGLREGPSHPQRLGLLLDLQHCVNVLIVRVTSLVAAFLADQIRGAHLIVPMDQHHRTT